MATPRKAPEDLKPRGRKPPTEPQTRQAVRMPASDAEALARLHGTCSAGIRAAVEAYLRPQGK